MEYFLVFYEWVCILFGIWYGLKRCNNWTWFDDDEHRVWVFLFAIFVVWFYWPLMLVYLYEDKKKAEQQVIEKIRKDAADLERQTRSQNGQGTRC